MIYVYALDIAHIAITMDAMKNKKKKVKKQNFRDTFIKYNIFYCYFQ